MLILIFCYGLHGRGSGVAHTDRPTFTNTHLHTCARIHTKEIARLGPRAVFWHTHTVAALLVLLHNLARQCRLAPELHVFTIGLRTALFALLKFLARQLGVCFRSICFHMRIAHCLVCLANNLKRKNKFSFFKQFNEAVQGSSAFCV